MFKIEFFWFIKTKFFQFFLKGSKNSEKYRVLAFKKKLELSGIESMFTVGQSEHFGEKKKNVL